MNQMHLIKNRFSLESEQNKKIAEFISAPTLLDLDKLAKYLNCVVYVGENKIYFFSAEIIKKHKISIPPKLKDMEFADVILSYEKGE